NAGNVRRFNRQLTEACQVTDRAVGIGAGDDNLLQRARTVQRDGFRLNAESDRPADKRGPVGGIGRDEDEKGGPHGRVPDVASKAWHDSFPPGGVKGSVPSGIQAGWFPLVGYDKREVSKTRRSRSARGAYQPAG